MLVVLTALAGATATTESLPSSARLLAAHRYITRTWHTLTRSIADLPRAAPDPKIHRPAGTPWPVYIARDEDRAAIEERLRRALRPRELEQIDLRTLPEGATVDDPGLLYLPIPHSSPICI